MPTQTRNPIQQPTEEVLAQAASILQQGGLVALPTETVYGLGADASNTGALNRLYTVKGRPGNHPVIVHIGDLKQLTDWAQDIPEAAFQLATAFWPGPLTLILSRTGQVPDAVTGGQDTVGIRIPDHPVALALLKAFGGGIAAPSANRFGRISPTSAEHVLSDLGQDVKLILDGGACEVGVESTIVAFPEGKPVILRPGRITAEQVETVLNQSLSPGSYTSAVRAPGTLASHYAPSTPVDILEWDALLALLRSNFSEPVAVLSRQASPVPLPPSVIWHQAPPDASAYTQNIYAALREIDQQNISHIYVEAVPSDSEWHAVADRLKRAAHK